MPLSHVAVGIQPSGKTVQPRLAPRHADVHLLHVGTAGHTGLANLFIFIGGKGTGGIHQQPPFPQHGHGRFQNSQLALGAGLHVGRTPAGQGVGLLTEHSLPRAGSIYQNAVKKAFKTALQPLRIRVQHHGVAHAQALQIGAQDPATGGDGLVGYQKPAPP